MISRTLIESEIGPIGPIKLWYSGNNWFADTKYGLNKLYWPYPGTDEEPTVLKIAELMCYFQAKKLGNVINCAKMASDHYYMLRKY